MMPLLDPSACPSVALQMTLEGRAGSSARIVTDGPVKHVATVSAGSIVADAARGNSQGTSWIVTFPSSNRNADGYVTIEARITASGR